MNQKPWRNFWFSKKFEWILYKNFWELIKVKNVYLNLEQVETHFEKFRLLLFDLILKQTIFSINFFIYLPILQLTSVSKNFHSFIKI